MPSYDREGCRTFPLLSIANTTNPLRSGYIADTKIAKIWILLLKKQDNYLGAKTVHKDLRVPAWLLRML